LVPPRVVGYRPTSRFFLRLSGSPTSLSFGGHQKTRSRAVVVLSNKPTRGGTISRPRALARNEFTNSYYGSAAEKAHRGCVHPAWGAIEYALAGGSKRPRFDFSPRRG